MKVAVVTGASRGVGYETAKQLATQYSCKVIAIARSSDKLEQLSKESSNIIKWCVDIKEITPKKFDAFLTQHQISEIDILVNNAGKLINKPFLELNYSDYKEVYDINVFGALLLTQLSTPYMLRADNPHIVNISSVGGVNNTSKFSGLSIYSSSKGALTVLSECLAEELKETNIKVNCLALGAVQTEMLEEAFPGYKAPISAQKMAEYISVFALNQHNYMNGQVIKVALSNP